jgi:hypothetical protein
MSQPVAVVITSADKPEILDQAPQTIRTDQPLSAGEQRVLLTQ